MLHLLVATTAVLAGKHSGQQHSVQPLLKLRGGVGLDASTAANVGMGLIAANGLYTGLAPGPASEAYGVKDASFTLQQMVKAVGYTQVAAATFAFCILNGVPLGMALGWAQVPWLLLTVDNILNKTPEKMGQPIAGQYLLLAINLATSYCGFTDTSATKAALFSAAWQALNGVIFALAPGKGAEAWGLAADTKVTLMMKNFGWNLAGGAALVYSVASGTEVTKSVGYLFALMMASLVDLTFVSNFFETMGADKTPAAVWGAIQAAVVAGTLF